MFILIKYGESAHLREIDPSFHLLLAALLLNWERDPVFSRDQSYLLVFNCMREQTYRLYSILSLCDL